MLNSCYDIWNNWFWCNTKLVFVSTKFPNRKCMSENIFLALWVTWLTTHLGSSTKLKDCRQSISVFSTSVKQHCSNHKTTCLHLNSCDVCHGHTIHNVTTCFIFIKLFKKSNLHIKFWSRLSVWYYNKLVNGCVMSLLTWLSFPFMVQASWDNFAKYLEILASPVVL